MQRLGIIAVIIENNRQSVEQVNKILSEFYDHIRARMGVPNKEKDTYLISLVVEISTEQLGALTGRLGNLAGVTVKSMMTNKSFE
ncbi:MAG: TM1266 family iron-only hydrogenase system putative regulator [Christensenellaceae bacterium]|jgi:putative iron-only hydrogenase system regulator